MKQMSYEWNKNANKTQSQDAAAAAAAFSGVARAGVPHTLVATVTGGVARTSSLQKAALTTTTTLPSSIRPSFRV